MIENSRNRWWTTATILLLFTIGLVLAVFVYRATTRIRNALAEEVLQQQRDVATLLYEYSSIMLAVEQLRLTPESDSREALDRALNAAQLQLKKMRSEYSFARLDGATKANAYIKPVLEDIAQWLDSGVPGHAADDSLILAIVAQRANDRFSGLRAIAAEADEVTQSLIKVQSRDLDTFRTSALMLLAAFALLVVTVIALLTRQRNMQVRVAEDQETQSRAIISTETTGREKAELALQGSEKILRETMDTLPSGISMLDQSGRIVAANSSWIQFISASKSQYTDGGIGESFLGVFVSAVGPAVEGSDSATESIRDVLAGTRELMGDEFQLGSLESLRWIALSTRSFKIQGEQHTVLIYEDVTERKQFEARDRRLRAELANVSRLTTAGEMASGLAHELNQPLTAISHNCHSALLCVREASVPDAELLESISEIYQQTQRAGSIVRSLRQLARHDSGSFKSTNINELVEETIRLTKPEAIEKGVDVRLRLADDLPEPLADPVQIQQVLVNLERNSVEAMGQGDSTSRSLTISTMIDQNTNIRVSVHDTGPGLTPGIKDKLFTAFQTTKSDGMGLGLSISRSIVEAHGGRLWFDQNVAAGTTFHFSLPVTEEVL